MIAALLAEGTSDKALLPILRWVLDRVSPVPARIEWIDPTSFERRPSTLREKVELAEIVCRCDLLFVHRDSDQQPPEWRYSEIHDAVGERPHVAVVPIRATEAWLLINEEAIRTASGRVSGVEDLKLPALARIEADADPKGTLHNALKVAHGATGRRAQRFHPPTAIQRLAYLIEDWSPLRELTAFQRLTKDTRAALDALGVAVHPSKP